MPEPTLDVPGCRARLARLSGDLVTLPRDELAGVLDELERTRAERDRARALLEFCRDALAGRADRALCLEELEMHLGAGRGDMTDDATLKPECLGDRPKVYRLTQGSTTIIAVGPMADHWLGVLAESMRTCTAAEWIRLRELYPAPPGVLAAMQAAADVHAHDDDSPGPGEG